jgi:hypothetical protein
MAALGALDYGTPLERGENALGGYVGGKLGDLAGNAVSRVVQPIRGVGNDAIDATKALFDKYNIKGLPGQVTGSVPLQWMASTLANLPGGGAIRSAVANQGGALNRAAMGAMGSAEDSVTPDAVKRALSAVGSRIGDATSSTTLAIDQPVAMKLINIENDHAKNLSPDQRAIVGSYIDDILQYGESGMPGDVYQKARSRISARAASTQDSELKTALVGIKNTLDNAFDDSASPAASDAVNTLRSQYRTGKVLQPMATEEGNISAARLTNAAKNLPPSAADLSALASKMKGLPDSGTAQRLFYQSLLSGGAGGAAGLATGDPYEAAKYAGGAFAAPWMASQLLTRAPMRQYLTNTAMPEEVKRLLELAGSAGGGLLGLRASQ